MIGYVTLGTNDLERTAPFYDAVLAEFGATRAMQLDRGILWSNGSGPAIIVTRPFDGNPATVGNGTMVALEAASQEQVNKVHATALANGAQDEGAPGNRGGTFYGAYFRDLDGNKLCVFHWPR
ncbi:VOC family protein [Pedomonas sp. V897]|uniref:VOC family protein n=1 Tax=Pedomonas sp. V897 TaxID=3446482 RepID=UPI003EDEF257